MARTEARIKTSRWKERDWRDLTMTAQWLYDALLTQSDLSKCGVVGYMPDKWAKLAKGLTVPKVIAALAELVEANFVVYDDETGEVWVRTFTKHDGILNLPATTAAMMKDYDAIVSVTIRLALLDGLGEGFVERIHERFPKWFAEGSRNPIPDGFAYGFGERFGYGSGERLDEPSGHVPDTRHQTPDSQTPDMASAEIAERQPRKPDEIWDALMTACGVSDITDSARGAYNKAKADLAGAGATPSEIHHRAGVYRRRWPDASLTPTALARRWPECAELPKRTQKPDAVDSVFGQLGVAR